MTEHTDTENTQTVPAETDDELSLVFQSMADVTYTPYQIHKLINGVRELAGLNPIRPQMMYNYSRNGLLGHKKADKDTPNTDHQYTRDEVEAYVRKYAGKQGVQVTFEDTDETDAE